MKPPRIPTTTFALAGIFLLVAGWPKTQAHGDEASALAGWAEVDITPPLGIALGGRGNAETVATQVIDPLSAEVLFIQDKKGTGFVLVSFDLVGMPHEQSERLRTMLVNELGASWNLVVLNFSHTHSGPYMLRSLMAAVGPAPEIETDYFKSLEQKLLEAARAARRNLQPVTVQVFQTNSKLGINRRGKDEQGRVVLAPAPLKFIDDEVWIMKLTPNNQAPSAVLFSYACHPVIVYGFANAAISADFPGATRQQLRRLLGTGTHAQFVQGFAGDIRPRILADLDHGTFRTPKPEDLSTAGAELAETVFAALKKPGRRLDLDLAGASDRPFLPRGEPPSRTVYEKIRAAALTNHDAPRLAQSEYWLKRYDAGGGFAKGDVWSLGLIRLARDQWIVHSGGEPCAEWRPKISKWLAGLKLVTWGYSEESRAYLPTEEMLPEGGYEVLDSNYFRSSTPAPYAPGIEAALRESLRRQLAFIKSK